MMRKIDNLNELIGQKGNDWLQSATPSKYAELHCLVIYKQLLNEELNWIESEILLNSFLSEWGKIENPDQVMIQIHKDIEKEYMNPF